MVQHAQQLAREVAARAVLVYTDALRQDEAAGAKMGQVLAVSVVFLALVAGIVGTTLGLLQAQKNLQQANENLAFARKGNDILGSVFTGLDPKMNHATVGEFSQALKDNLQKAVQELEGSALGDPLTVAQMQTYTLSGSPMDPPTPS
jgi:hypothetical protein